MKTETNSTARVAVRGPHVTQWHLWVLGICWLVMHVFPGRALAAVPILDVTFVGGTPTAVNNVGQAVGYSDVGGVNSAWVYTPGEGMTFLPAPAGWGSSAYDISDTGVIVGNVDDGIYGTSGDAADGAAVWRPTTTGYELTLINNPDTDMASAALRVNSLGDIIGTRTFLTEWRPGSWQTVTRGFLLTHDGTFVPNLSDIGFDATPSDINDRRQIVGRGLRMDVATGLVEALPLAPVTDGKTFINYVDSYGINESGQVAASAVVATGGRVAARFTNDVGWDVLTLPGTSNTAYSVNDNGDVLMYVNAACGNSSAPVVNLGADGTYCLQTLLSDQNWQIATPYASVVDLNNNRDAIAIAQNLVTGEFGGILLTAAGDLPPPIAPTDLVAVPHEATPQQPFIAIDLTWTDNSDNETAFRVERSPAGAGQWAEIGRVRANTWGFRDNDIVPLAEYDYRVIAVGPGGESVSNVATAIAPDAVDTQAPEVLSLVPADGAQVSGNFDVTVTARDNVAVSFVEMFVDINGATTRICSVSDPVAAPGTSQFEVTCSANAKKLKLQNGQSLPITVNVYDAMLNSASASVTVTWGSGSGGGGKGGNGGGKGRK